MQCKIICKTEVRMDDKLEFTEFEKKAYAKKFEDGALEIMIGSVMIAISLYFLLTEVGIQRPFNILLLVIPGSVIYYFVKKKITNPRLGQVNYGERRKRSLKTLLMASVIAIVSQVSLILFIQAKETPYMGTIFPSLLSFLLIAVPLLIFAHYNDYNRFYAIAILISLAWPASELLAVYFESPWDGVIPFSTIGILILVVGLVSLTRFAKNNPLPETRDLNDEF